MDCVGEQESSERFGTVAVSDEQLWVVSPPFQTAPHRQIGRGVTRVMVVGMGKD